jgi:hypothetical protein
MEEQPMLMHWQNQHGEDDCTTEINLHIQCNLHQSSNDILHRDRKINPNVHMKA